MGTLTLAKIERSTEFSSVCEPPSRPCDEGKTAENNRGVYREGLTCLYLSGIILSDRDHREKHSISTYHDVRV